MPNTTNFNWPTPADTDLVKDGAAAIRNLGDGVDTSLVDLKGGTTGQILSKASDTDMDFAFITPNVGDLTEVQAGTGISVADGTGPIPIVTNTVATEFDAKGDLVVGTGSDTFDRLAVGTDGYTLVADSVETTGLKWAAPAVGGGMTLISETVASALSSLSFSSLGSYKQLVLMYSGIRHSNNSSSFVVRLNNDSGSNYHKSGMSGQETTLRLGGETTTHLGDANNATWCAFGVKSNYASLSTDVMGYIVIDNYTSSTKGKAVFAAYSYFNNGGGGYYAQSLNHFVDITSAITSIDIVRLTGAGTFSNTANTTIRLYGVN
jgi:hypothetical protein